MSRIVCYTCIVGPYDQLKEVEQPNANVDYICFTDQPFESRTWQIRSVPDDLKFLSNVKKQRIVKICPHRYLKEYDVSVWVDGSILVKGDIIKFINQYDLDKNFFYSRFHPSRKCIYDEAKACIRLKKDNSDKINAQIEKYRNDGYPPNIGMVETNILLRNHNDMRCILLCNRWGSELLLGSHRDQLSFNYVCWKNKITPGYLTHEFNIMHNNFFLATNHA